jgi:hypothetical protein
MMFFIIEMFVNAVRGLIRKPNTAEKIIGFG